MSLYKDASLVMIPSAYKDGKLYSIRPTDGSGDFTFSRGSNLAATRVDVNGLIEKGRENLVLQSNQFDTSWIASRITITANQLGYDGSNDAWLIESTATAQSSRIHQNYTSTGVYNRSVYAKKGTADYLAIYTTGDAKVYFNLSTGTIDTESQNVSASMISVGNGWYRCSATFSSGYDGHYIFIAATNNSTSTNSGDNIYIQDAQLEQGLVATDYIETGTSAAQSGILEDMPRLDYSGGASCPSLLLEPQRTNLLTHSEYFGGWNVVSQGTGSAPSLSIGGDFPLGDGKYYNLQCDLNGGTTSSDRSYITLGGLSGTQFTAAKSLWIKNNSASEVSLFAGINFSADEFTLAANADWQRITIEGGVINSEFRIGLGGGASNSDSIDVSIFGAQCESGSYPTSYIPTYGTSQTRSADVCYNDTDDFAGVDQVTLFAELDNNGNDRAGAFFRFNLNQGSSSAEWIFLGYESNKSVRFYVRSNASTSVDRSAGNYGAGVLKMAAKIDSEGNYKLFANGVEISYGSNAVLSTLLNRVNIGQTNGSTNMEDRVKQILIFPTALTDSECIALTTL